MAFNVTTTNTWAFDVDQSNPARVVDVCTKVTEMVGEGKTDGIFLIESPTVTIRYWVDLAAAQEFVAFVSARAAVYNCTLVSTEYGTRA